MSGLDLNKSDDAAWATPDGTNAVADITASRDDVTNWKRTRLLSTFNDDGVFVVLIVGSSWSSAREFLLSLRKKVPTLDDDDTTEDVEKGWVNANVAENRQLPHRRTANKTEPFIVWRLS